ncbi:MAG: FCD domain-containing protein [Candidatus Aminicenantes bacterium]|nr:FCD domain-containing protein [Candidatus Aminicenantes bacterium]
MNKKFKSLPEPIIPKTLSQSIYNYLKEAIISHQLKANQRINEKEIAELFQVSITPVREAVLRLGAEGFVDSNFHREAMVSKVSYQELKEIFQVLGVLDSLAAGLILDTLNQDELKELESLTKKMERHCHLNSIDKYLELNISIHNKIWDSIPNKFLQTTLRYVNAQTLRYSYAFLQAYRKQGVLKRSLDEHKEILKALNNKNKKKLKGLMSKHWGSLLESSPSEKRWKEYLDDRA